MNKIVLVVTKLVAYLTSPTYTDEQIKFAYQLRQQGMTYKMIARKTGISLHPHLSSAPFGNR